jgi:hypothetical protein
VLAVVGVNFTEQEPFESLQDACENVPELLLDQDTFPVGTTEPSVWTVATQVVAEPTITGAGLQDAVRTPPAGGLGVVAPEPKATEKLVPSWESPEGCALTDPVAWDTIATSMASSAKEPTGPETPLTVAVSEDETAVLS